MPTLHRERNWKITIYAGDHPPPHFHVQTPDGESLVDLAGLVELQAGAERRALADALAWARSNQSEIEAMWQSLNPEGAT